MVMIARPPQRAHTGWYEPCAAGVRRRHLVEPLGRAATGRSGRWPVRQIPPGICLTGRLRLIPVAPVSCQVFAEQHTRTAHAGLPADRSYSAAPRRRLAASPGRHLRVISRSRETAMPIPDVPPLPPAPRPALASLRERAGAGCGIRRRRFGRRLPTARLDAEMRHPRRWRPSCTRPRRSPPRRWPRRPAPAAPHRCSRAGRGGRAGAARRCRRRAHRDAAPRWRSTYEHGNGVVARRRACRRAVLRGRAPRRRGVAVRPRLDVRERPRRAPRRRPGSLLLPRRGGAGASSRPGTCCA